MFNSVADLSKPYYEKALSLRTVVRSRLLVSLRIYPGYYTSTLD